MHLTFDPDRCISRVLLDDTDVQGNGGKAYETFGVSPSAGALIVVRPDGYVGTIAPLDRVDVLDAYFDTNLKLSGPSKL
jgi:phenol 2-monooxygenase (NADPH)